MQLYRQWKITQEYKKYMGVSRVWDLVLFSFTFLPFQWIYSYTNDRATLYLGIGIVLVELVVGVVWDILWGGKMLKTNPKFPWEDK